MQFCESVSLQQVVMIPWHAGHGITAGTLQYKNDQGAWTDAGVQGASFHGHGTWRGTGGGNSPDDFYWVIGEAAATSRFWRVVDVQAGGRFAGAQVIAGAPAVEEPAPPPPPPTSQMLKLAAPDANPAGWTYSDDQENSDCNSW